MSSNTKPPPKDGEVIAVVMYIFDDLNGGVDRNDRWVTHLYTVSSFENCRKTHHLSYYLGFGDMEKWKDEDVCLVLCDPPKMWTSKVGTFEEQVMQAKMQGFRVFQYPRSIGACAIIPVIMEYGWILDGQMTER